MQRIDEPSHILIDSTGTETGSGPWTLKCSDCNMIFGVPSLLEKHKERFCVGSQLGDPDALMLRRRLRDQDRPDQGDPEEEETPRYDPSKDARALELAELHGKQMEFLKNQNRELEQQREEIRRQLEALGQRQHPVKDDKASEELLKELREEEERSRKMLEELRRQLAEARRPINIIPSERPATETKTYGYPIVYGGGSLVGEIMMMKQTYISNGGNDQHILDQLEQMLAEAQALEESLRNMPPKQPKEREDSSQLISVEMENKKLLEQLIQLQEQKMLNKHRQDSREGELEHELRRMRRDHLRKMHELQLQIERMRHDSHVDRMLLELQLRNQTTAAPPTKLIVKQRPPPPAPAPPPPQTEAIEMGPPYDDDEGFVIFYDFVLNLEPNVFAMRLLVGLHNMTNKLGEPSVMPMVYTEPSVGPQMENVCNAVLGARQPVRKCPSMSDLGIVVELQVAGAIGSNHDPTRLITRAWTKIPLFDGQSRLYVGRFKLPLRHSPIKPFIPFGELDEIAQFGDAELYYRIVHSRDASVHSMATIAATNRELYLPAPVPVDPPPADWDNELDEAYYRLPSRPSEAE